MPHVAIHFWLKRKILTVQAENAVRYHSKQASDWTRKYSTRTFSVRFEVLESLLQDNQLAGQYWLDAGCGTGTLARWLAERKQCRVLGVDASAEMILQCEAVAGAKFSVIKDIRELEFADGQFDGVLCSSVLEYLESPQAGLRELRRVIKENGLLIASVPNSHFWTRLNLFATYWLTRPLGSKRQFSFLDHSKWSYSPETFSQLLRACGFVGVGYRKYGECRFRNYGIKGEGSMVMFLARPIPHKDRL